MLHVSTNTFFCSVIVKLSTSSAVTSVVGLETGLGLETSFAGLGSRYPEVSVLVSVLVSVSDPSGLEYLAGLASRPAFFIIMQLITEHPNLPPLPAQYDFASNQ